MRELGAETRRSWVVAVARTATTHIPKTGATQSLNSSPLRKLTGHALNAWCSTFLTRSRLA
jgi:hypothetical protein